MKTFFTFMLLLFAVSSEAQISTIAGGTGSYGLQPYRIVTGGTSLYWPVQQIDTGIAGQALVSNGGGHLPTFQTLAGTVADSIYTATGDTIKYAAGQTNAWLENDSGTTAHFYLMQPDSATMEGTVLNITTIFAARDTITVIGGVDKNLTTILMYNGLGAPGAPGTSVVLTCHKGKLYSRNSGFVIQ